MRRNKFLTTKRWGLIKPKNIKVSMLIVSIILCMTTFVRSQSTCSQMISNGSFGSGNSGLIYNGSQRAAPTDANIVSGGYTGTNSAKLSSKMGFNAAAYEAIWFSCALKKDITYEIEFWVKTNNNTTLNGNVTISVLGINALKEDKITILKDEGIMTDWDISQNPGFKPAVNSTEWQRVYAKFKPKNDIIYLDIHPYCITSSTFTIWFSDVKVYQQPYLDKDFTTCGVIPASYDMDSHFGKSWKWSTGATTRNISASLNETKTYTVTATTCLDTQVKLSQTITHNARPTVTVTQSTKNCLGEPLTLTANVKPLGTACTYLWSNAATTNSITVAPTQNAQLFTVTAISGPSCSSTGKNTTDQYLPPALTTQAVSNIGLNSALGNATITSLGSSNITQYGLVWSKLQNPTIALTTKTEYGTRTLTGSFCSYISGLSAYTTYYVRSYATNATCTSYGPQVTFTTANLPCIVTTQDATNITQTTATGNGTITSLGLPYPTQYGVIWSTTTTSPTVDLTTKTQQGATTTTGAFTSNITGLTSGTIYYVRAYATNGNTTSYGSTVIFKTYLTPTVTTQMPTAITATTAKGNGTIVSLGNPAEAIQYGVVWSRSPNPTIDLATKTMQGTRNTTGTFTSDITGLTPFTQYYVRAYVTNAAGTTYGNQQIFRTLVIPTSISTQAVTNINRTTATANGNFDVLGVPNPEQYGFVWCISPSDPTVALTTKTSQGIRTTAGAFTASMIGLLPNTTYIVKAYATTNIMGYVSTIYGNPVVFTTADKLPLVTTQIVTKLGMNTALGNGTITCIGTANLTQYGVVWSTSPNPTIPLSNSTAQGARSSIGSYTSSMTELLPNTKYYVRAYAINAYGTSYGNEVTFTTLLCTPNTSYAIPQTFSVGTEITPIFPINSCYEPEKMDSFWRHPYGLYPWQLIIDSQGNVTAVDLIVKYKINKPLPDGLFFNCTTGDISGTPYVTSPATTYTIKTADKNGEYFTNITISVNSTLKSNVEHDATETGRDEILPTIDYEKINENKDAELIIAPCPINKNQTFNVKVVGVSADELRTATLKVFMVNGIELLNVSNVFENNEIAIATNGIYFVQIQTSNGTILTSKIIVNE